MKRIMSFFLAVLCIFSISSCDHATFGDEKSDQNKTNDTNLSTKDGTEKSTKNDDAPADEVVLIRFSSIEEFETAIDSAVEGGDVADLASLDMYYLPTGIPEGYELYKILAGTAGIGFYYLPEDCLESEETIMLAESQRQYFQFVSPRGSYTFKNTQEQFDISDDELVDNKYFIHKSSSDIVFWDENGDSLMLCLPRENENEGISTEERGTTIYALNDDEIDISDLLKTEMVIIE